MKQILITAAVFALASCSRTITGTVKEVQGNTVTLTSVYKIKVDTSKRATKMPLVGDTIKLRPTVNRRAINARFL